MSTSFGLYISIDTFPFLNNSMKSLPDSSISRKVFTGVALKFFILSTVQIVHYHQGTFILRASLVSLDESSYLFGLIDNNKIMKTYISGIFLFCVLILAACGGGGDDADAVVRVSSPHSRRIVQALGYPIPRSKRQRRRTMPTMKDA